MKKMICTMLSVALLAALCCVPMTAQAATTIDKVELPAPPAAVPMGETYTYDRTVENQAIAETEAYTVTGGWRQYIPNEGTFGDFVFKEGAMYVYKMWVYTKSGYEISDNTVFTAGGKTISRDNIYHYFSGRNATICQFFNHTSLKPISVVDITVAKPTIGNKIDTQAKTTTAGVEIDKFFIKEMTSADVTVPMEMGNTMLDMQSTSGNYITDKYYLATGYIKAASGYYFAADLTVRVNGKKASLFPSYINNMFEMGSPTESNPFILSLGKATAPTTTTTTTTTAKPTDKKPTPTTAGNTSAVDDQSDIGEPTDAVSDVVDDTVSEQEPLDDDTITIGATDEDDTDKKNPLPIILAVAGGVLVLGGAAVSVYFFLKKKNG